MKTTTTTTTKTTKKRSEETQTLRAGARLAELKIFATPQTPFLGAWDGQNLISWRWSLPSPTDPVEDRCMQYRVIMVTDPKTHTLTHPHTQTGPITIHCTAARAQCKKLNYSASHDGELWCLQLTSVELSV